MNKSAVTMSFGDMDIDPDQYPSEDIEDYQSLDFNTNLSTLRDDILEESSTTISISYSNTDTTISFYKKNISSLVENFIETAKEQNHLEDIKALSETRKNIDPDTKAVHQVVENITSSFPENVFLDYFNESTKIRNVLSGTVSDNITTHFTTPLIETSVGKTLNKNLTSIVAEIVPHVTDNVTNFLSENVIQYYFNKSDNLRKDTSVNITQNSNVSSLITKTIQPMVHNVISKVSSDNITTDYELDDPVTSLIEKSAEVTLNKNITLVVTEVIHSTMENVTNLSSENVIQDYFNVSANHIKDTFVKIAPITNFTSVITKTVQPIIQDVFDTTLSDNNSIDNHLTEPLTTPSIGELVEVTLNKNVTSVLTEAIHSTMENVTNLSSENVIQDYFNVSANPIKDTFVKIAPNTNFTSVITKTVQPIIQDVFDTTLSDNKSIDYHLTQPITPSNGKFAEVTLNSNATSVASKVINHVVENVTSLFPENTAIKDYLSKYVIEKSGKILPNATKNISNTFAQNYREKSTIPVTEMNKYVNSFASNNSIHLASNISSLLSEKLKMLHNFNKNIAAPLTKYIKNLNKTINTNTPFTESLQNSIGSTSNIVNVQKDDNNIPKFNLSLQEESTVSTLKNHLFDTKYAERLSISSRFGDIDPTDTIEHETPGVINLTLDNVTPLSTNISEATMDKTYFNSNEWIFYAIAGFVITLILLMSIIIFFVQIKGRKRFRGSYQVSELSDFSNRGLIV